jgi:hypothetical protein
MDAKRISMVFCAVLLALTPAAFAGPASVTSPEIIAPPRSQIEPVHYWYRSYHRRALHGALAGPTGGWPYFGWYGYPYSYRYGGGGRYRHHSHYRHPYCRHYHY